MIKYLDDMALETVVGGVEITEQAFNQIALRDPQAYVISVGDSAGTTYTLLPGGAGIGTALTYFEPGGVVVEL